MKKLLSALLALSPALASAQTPQVTLKHPITKADSIYIVKLAKEALTYGTQLSTQYISSDLSSSAPVNPDKPFNIADVHKLEKQLKNNYDDASIYYDIGVMYVKKFDVENGAKYLNMALEKALERVKAKPDSASSYYKLGNIYYWTQDYSSGAKAYEQGIKLDPADTVYRFVLPGFYGYTYDMDAAMKAIRANISKFPDNPKSYSVLPFYYFVAPMVEMRSYTPEQMSQRFTGKSAMDAVDISMIREAYEKHRNNIDFEMMYYMSRLNVQIVKLAVETQLDSITPPGKLMFRTDVHDSINVSELKKYFTSALTNPAIKNKYVIYKSLAYLEILSNKPTVAIPYLQKAIKARPADKGTFEVNCGEDYNTLAGCYFIAGDTVGYERTIKEKVAVKPMINPSPHDMVVLAEIAFHHNDYAAAKKYATDALAIYPTLDDAYVVLAAVNIVKGENNEALMNLGRGFKINNNNVDIAYYSGLCLLLLHNDPAIAYQYFVASKNGMVNHTTDKEVLDYFFNVK